MKKNIKKISKSNIQTKEKLIRAAIEYKRLMAEIAPFIPKTKVENVTTEGRWQTTSSIVFE